MRQRAVIDARADFDRALGTLFELGSPQKWDVIETAIRGRAHPTLLIALVDIPDRTYATLDELWSFVAPEIGTG